VSEPAWSGPIPAADPETEPFWTGLARHEIVLQRCTSCSTWVHRPLSHCPNCWSAPLGHEKVDGFARIYTFSKVYRQFVPGVPSPYVVALVELDAQPGIRLLTNIVNCDFDDVKIGLEVGPVFRDIGDGVSLLYYAPRKSLEETL
jgi:uncharacterized OB-fold protein